MKYKLLLIVFTLLSVFQTISAQSSVWKVESENSHLYIGGTIHVLRDVDYPLPIEFEKAFKYADKLVFETDIDGMSNPETMKEMMKKFSYSDGRTLKSDLSEEAYSELAREAKKLSLPIEKMGNFKPSMLILTLTIQGLKEIGVKKDGVDKYYNDQGKLLNNKQIGFLESIDFQIDLMTSMGEGKASEYVLSSLKDYKNIKVEFLNIISSWRKGEIKYFKKQVKEMKRDYPGLYKSMLLDRNNNWIPKIDNFLKDKKTEFVLVGNLHLHGENGILTLLEKKGYKISQVQVTKQEEIQLLKVKGSREKVLEKSVVKEWEKVRGEEYGFSALMPGKATVSSQIIPSASGDLKMDVFAYTPIKSNDNLIYMIVNSVYPDGSIQSDNKEKIESFFQKAIEGAVSKVKGKVLSQKDLQLNGYLGKELKINYNNGTHIIRLRMYLVEDKLYMLQVISETKKSDNESSNKFMESFQLLEKKN